MSNMHILASAAITNLKIFCELFLDHGRGLRLWSAMSQEHIVLKIYYLREDRRPLTNLFRVLRRLSVPRYEPQACRADETTGFLDVLTSEGGPSEDNAAGSDGQCGL